MNILLAGVFTPHSTNTPMAAALESLGHRVERLPYRRCAAEGRLASALAERAKHADAVVVCKGFGGDVPPLLPEVLRSVACRKAYWFPDAVELHGILPVDLALACDAACATSLQSCAEFARWGHKAVSQIFEGFDPAVWRPRDHGKKAIDVAFAGSLDDHRASLLDALATADLPVRRVNAWGKDLARAYSRSKVVLNFVRGEIFSDRVIQGLACGAFVLSEYCQDLETAFDLGAELDVFWAWTDLRDKVRGALASDEWREGVARAGHRAAQRFTWTKQMAKLVRAIEGERVADGAFCHA